METRSGNGWLKDMARHSRVQSCFHAAKSTEFVVGLTRLRKKHQEE